MRLRILFGIATLGSILDSQLSWESGKSQLARWNHEVVLFSARTDSTRPTRPPSLVLKLLYYHLWSVILAYVYDHCQTASGGFLEGVWRVSGECLESAWKVSWRCMEVVRKMSGRCLDFDPILFGLPIITEWKILLNLTFLGSKIFLTQNFPNTEFFWHCQFFQALLNFSGTEFFRSTRFELRNFWTNNFSD